MNLLRTLALAGALAGCASAANAAIFVYDFTATVTSAAPDHQNLFPGGFGVGTQLTGTFSWDDGAASLVNFGGVEVYRDPANSTAALAVSGGGISITDLGDTETDDRTFTVTDAGGGPGADAFDRTADLSRVTFTGLNSAPDFSGGASFLLHLAARAGENPFTSTAIPSALDSSKFDLDGGSFFHFLAVDGDGDASQIFADITSFALVPEPAATTLAFAGLCGAALLLRRLRRAGD